MPNMKDAEKKILIDAKRQVTNNHYEATIKTAIKIVYD